VAITLEYEVIEILHPTNSQEFYLELFHNAQLKSYLEHKWNVSFLTIQLPLEKGFPRSLQKPMS
jgi:hypothetical protein